MEKNEYRRAFIMLRPAAQGYGGHVRLERRTLTGSMYFIVTAPQGVGTLTAALAGQRNGEYYAATLGQLSRDRRGQLTLAKQFDPRGIDGRPLEAYAWVVVAEDPCTVVLTGNVEGSRPMDQQALARAVCALLAPRAEPAADLPEPEPMPEPTPEPMPEPVPEPTQEPAPEPTESADTQGDVKVYTRLRSRRRPAAARPTTPSSPTEAQPQPEPAPVQAEARTAAEALGLDITSPWPGTAESLRRLFATQAPLNTALGEGYVYVEAPMPKGCGYARCVIGLTAENGAITGVRYALPGPYAPEPPAGMDGYAWRDAGGEGWWVLDATEL